MDCFASRESLVALTLTIGAASCGTGGGAIEFRTDQARYTLSQDSAGLAVNIPFTYVNQIGRTIYVANCNQIEQITLEKRAASEQWIPAWSGIYPLCLSPPLVIPHGSTRSGVMDVSAGAPGSNLHPQFQVSEFEGTYRLVWHDLYWSYDPNRRPFGEELPMELRVSADFTLEAPR
jgi:hypothetical protein